MRNSFFFLGSCLVTSVILCISGGSSALADRPAEGYLQACQSGEHRMFQGENVLVCLQPQNMTNEAGNMLPRNWKDGITYYFQDSSGKEGFAGTAFNSVPEAIGHAEEKLKVTKLEPAH